MSIFVDTSAFVAYLNRDDQHHTTAARVMQSLAKEKSQLVTTNYTILETTALLQRRLGLAALQDFQEVIFPFLTITWVDAALHDLGVTAVLAANRRRMSLVDCISFVVCRRQGIQQVFAFDQHFAEQGFTLLDYA
jgi:predicted nucleic acid-binding protein